MNRGPSGPLAVTGAGGYLGSRLIADLTGAGQPTRALTRGPVPWLGADDQRVIDLLGPVEAIAAAIDGCRALVHLAGHNEVVAAREPDRALAETVVLARHVAEAAALAGIPRVVFVSTIHVYGARLEPGSVVDEEVPPEPRGVYAVARLAAEHLLADSADAVILRLSNAVGAPAHPAVDRWTLVAADLCRSSVELGELTLRSSGLQWRDFIGLADVVRLIDGATDPGVVAAGTYNLASGRAVTVRDLALLVQERVEAKTGRRPVLRAPDPDGPGPDAYQIDPSRLAATGLMAEQQLPDALDEIIDLCLTSPSTGASR